MDAEKSLSAEEVLAELFCRRPELDACRQAIEDAYELLLACFSHGSKLLVCGNGGSASDSEHIVGELMKSFRFRRPVDPAFSAAYLERNGEAAPGWLEGALPAISLVSQTSLSTAFANDETGVGAFAQQVLGYGRTGDVLMCISTSGDAANAVEAAKVARALGMRVVSLTGKDGSALSRISDACVQVPETETFKVQELHLPVYHALCAALEAALF